MATDICIYIYIDDDDDDGGGDDDDCDTIRTNNPTML